MDIPSIKHTTQWYRNQNQRDSNTISLAPALPADAR